MRALRTHYADETEFVRRVDEVQRPQGYRLVGAFSDDGRCRRGYGRALLEWCAAEGERLGCTEFHLDSGVGPEREDAHRLYFNTGLRITSFHFARRLE